MTPARAEGGSPRGYIVAVGGAEGKVGDPTILRRFVRLAGGRDARIAIIATASQLPDTGERYEAVFRDLGVRAARTLPLDTRQDAEAEEWVEKLERADAIFLTGGNQLRLSTILGGTPVAKAIRRRNAMGAHVAGTSAGAAFLSEHMIATGDEGATPHAGSVTLSPGLGLTNRVVIDQHFRQRDRLGRLLSALAYNPFAIGLGLDEDTAAFIGPDNTFEVAGTGAITVVDPAEVEFSSMDQLEKDDPVCLIGVRLHVLVRGATFDLSTRKAYAPQATG
ncbi:MAG TPA: cyanophycinase [Gemmatimonadales bacterium]|nr:cyanophycinase [Gemmatimonadales bacterium]